ncbi:MAG: glycosyltransferase family A protein, partial [Candidatus Paceibacterota bacterium]
MHELNKDGYGIKPYIKVIIPVYNDWENLEKCLSLLEIQDYPKTQYEVIVVDNGSDFIPELPSYNCKITVIHCKKPGSYAARNKGLEHGNSDITAFIDSDCQPTNGWISNGVNSLVKKDNVGIVAGKVSIYAVDKDKLNSI